MGKFCDLDKNIKHIGEVATGHVDGKPSGAVIDTSTNEVTGEERETLTGLLKNMSTSFDTQLSSQSEQFQDRFNTLAPIPWTPNTLIEENQSLQVFENDGLFYLPNVKKLPFTTGATFNADNWVLSELVTYNQQLRDIGDIRGFGGICDGVTLDDDAVEKAQAYGNLLTFPAGKEIALSKAIKYRSNDKIRAYGSVIRSSASSIIEAKGSSIGNSLKGGNFIGDDTNTFLTVVGGIGFGKALGAFNLSDLIVTMVDLGFDLTNARTGKLDNVRCSSNKGILYSGKAAEVNITNSFFIQRGNITGSYGLQCIADSHGYPEGISVTNTLFFRFAKNLIIHDIYEFKSVGNYYDGEGSPDGKQFEIKKNTFLKGVKFIGDWISKSGVDFPHCTSPALNNCSFSACEFNDITTGLDVGNFQQDIKIIGSQFTTLTEGVGLVCSGQNSGVTMSGCSFDSRFLSMAQFKGKGSKSCSLSNLTGGGNWSTRNPIYIDDDNYVQLHSIEGLSMFIKEAGFNGTWVNGQVCHSFGDVPLPEGSYSLNIAALLGVGTSADARITINITPIDGGAIDVADTTGVSSLYIELGGACRLSETLNFSVKRYGKFTVKSTCSRGTVSTSGFHGTISLVRL